MDCGQPVKQTFFHVAALWLIGVVSSFFRALGWRACRFYPSCSCYAREAFASTHFFKASWLSARRVFKCHPFSAGGYDPVHISIKRESSIHGK